MKVEKRNVKEFLILKKKRIVLVYVGFVALGELLTVCNGCLCLVWDFFAQDL